MGLDYDYPDPEEERDEAIATARGCLTGIGLVVVLGLLAGVAYLWWT